MLFLAGITAVERHHEREVERFGERQSERTALAFNPVPKPVRDAAELREQGGVQAAEARMVGDPVEVYRGACGCEPLAEN